MIKKAILAVAFVIFLSNFAFADCKSPSADAIPPFLGTTSTIPPNVLIVMDISGSMTWDAYKTCSWSCKYTWDKKQKVLYLELNKTCPNYIAGSKEGYFNPNHRYSYDSSQKYWYINDNASVSSCPSGSTGDEIDPNNSYDGACLNYNFMTRIDLVRWVLTGGKPASCSSASDPNCDPRTANTDGNNIKLKTSNGEGIIVLSQITVLTPTLGQFVLTPNGEGQFVLTPGQFVLTPGQAASTPGLILIMDDGNRLTPDKIVLKLSQQPDQTVLTPMDRINSSLLISLANDTQNVQSRIGLEMFSDNVASDKVYIGDYTTGGSNDPSKPYTNVIKMINATSPGGSTATGPAMKAALDYFAQKSVNDMGNDCKQQDYSYNNGFSPSQGTWKDPMYQPCKKDHTASSDSFCSAECANNYVILMSDGDWNTGGDPLKPAWYMHNVFKRTLNNTDFKINRVYTVGMFLSTGSGACGFNALKNVSLYGSNTFSTYPTKCTGYDPDKKNCSNDCSNTDYGNYGAYGSYCYTPSPDPTTTNPQTAFSANNASDLKNSLSAIFQDIQKNVSSGSSAAIAPSLSAQGSMILQSVFWPQKTFDNGATVSWVGKLYAWWLQQSPVSAPVIRADNGNKELASTNTEINFGTNPSNVFDNNTPIFEAGAILLKTDAKNRKIYTTTDGKTLLEFTASNAQEIESFFCLNKCLNNTSLAPEDLINYIRGQDLTGTRPRTVTENGGVWKLGDIVYSSPAVMQKVDYTNPSETYNVIFVGANDGMLHAFLLGQPINTYQKDTIVKLCNDNKFTMDASGNITCTDGNDKVGSELWAFIPKNSLPYLKYLADPSYDTTKHLYFNDLEPFVFKAYTQNGVKTILIGGMRFGGCVKPPTKPCDNPTSECCNNPPSDSCSAGYSSYYALDVTDPEHPSLLWEFSNPKLGFSYSGPAIVKEYDGIQNNYFVVFLSGPTDYDGTSNQPVNLFILDLMTGELKRTMSPTTDNKAFGGRLFTGGIIDNANSLTKAIPFGISYQDKNGNWLGKVFLLNTYENADYTKWKIVPVDLKFDDSNATLGPITAQVATSKCQSTRQYIYFGTGRYFKPTDPITSPNENIFGVDVTSCINNDSCSVSLTKVTPSNQIGKTYVPGFSWYVPLDSSLGERDISDPSADSNSVTFTTALPTGGVYTSNSLCISGYGGQTNVWSLTCGTGAPNQSGQNYLISTSSGGIYQASANSSKGIIGTFSGIPAVKKPTEVPYGTNKGIIIQWLEK